MEEWRFDLTNPEKGVGVIMTASSTTVALNVPQHVAAAVVEAHNEEWKRTASPDLDLFYYLVSDGPDEDRAVETRVVYGTVQDVMDYKSALNSASKVPLTFVHCDPVRVTSTTVSGVLTQRECLEQIRQYRLSLDEQYAQAIEALRKLGAVV